MVPRVSSETYLQAVVTNTSSYSILSGPANVFLDNNFIAKVTYFASQKYKFKPTIQFHKSLYHYVLKSI